MSPEAAQQLAADCARSAGLALTPDALSAVAEQIAATLDRDQAGGFSYTESIFGETFRLDGERAVDVPPGEFIAGLLQKHGRAAAPVSQTSTSDTPPTRSAPRDPWAALSQGLTAKHDAAMVRETEKMPNPWLAGQVHRTNQAIITNKNPELAARYRKEAGL